MVTKDRLYTTPKLKNAINKLASEFEGKTGLRVSKSRLHNLIADKINRMSVYVKKTRGRNATTKVYIRSKR